MKATSGAQFAALPLVKRCIEFLGISARRHASISPFAKAVEHSLQFIFQDRRWTQTLLIDLHLVYVIFTVSFVIFITIHNEKKKVNFEENKTVA